MPLKVITADGQTHEVHAPRDLEKIFGIQYLGELSFSKPELKSKILKRCEKALRKGWITPRQKWLGHFYSEGLRGKISLDITIKWIDASIGYGVFTNTDIPAQTFIGEYTGVLRKRSLFGRWKNHYCFSYNIGESRLSSYVIDAEKSSNHTRFINHSHTPNLEPAGVYCDGLLHVIVFSTRLILAGEQLCYDYGEDYWKKRSCPVPINSH
ncbi:MAG: SET domain-containing protein-lysine N-methyltransferase [Candidatus Melainabacteria bacterium]|nr:SET domain-containing protein-lysine N-methyltransferase [Candidatus Melainabacteria bacterium]